MRRTSPILPVLLLVSSAVSAEQVGVWRTMEFHDLRTPSPSDPLQTLVWPDVIQEANAYARNELKQDLGGRNAYLTALSATYQVGDRTIIVSTALTRSCESGANDKDADIEPSICPVRIATINGGRLSALATVTGCYADHADPDLPPANRDDTTLARYDPAAQTIELRTRVGGRTVPACDRSYSIK